MKVRKQEALGLLQPVTALRPSRPVQNPLGCAHVSESPTILVCPPNLPHFPKHHFTLLGCCLTSPGIRLNSINPVLVSTCVVHHLVRGLDEAPGPLLLRGAESEVSVVTAVGRKRFMFHQRVYECDKIYTKFTIFKHAVSWY